MRNDKKSARPAAGRRQDGRAARVTKPRAGVLDRAIALLMSLSASPRPATLNEVARAAGLSKATAFRILATLSEQGFVEHDATTATYRLGIAPLRLATAVLDGIEVHGVARPVMRAVCDMLNETVVLSVRDGDYRINIDAVECTNAIGSSRRIGEPRPLHSGAASRALLATLSDAEIEAYMKRHRLGRAHGGSPRYAEALWKDIRKARRTRLASMVAETSPQSHAVATTIPGRDGQPIAALHVAIPRSRFSARVEDRCGQALVRAAGEIATDMAAAGGISHKWSGAK
jgi:IclR family acetate operon transcriptional repressor